VSTCKAGKLNDACFDKLKPLYCNGEPFVEQLKSALQQKNASLKKNVTDKAWKVNTEGDCGQEPALNVCPPVLPVPPSSHELRVVCGWCDMHVSS
jgi:hypothetical protein